MTSTKTIVNPVCYGSDDDFEAALDQIANTPSPVPSNDTLDYAKLEKMAKYHPGADILVRERKRALGFKKTEISLD
jgi:hypothetical protein